LRLDWGERLLRWLHRVDVEGRRTGPERPRGTVGAGCRWSRWPQGAGTRVDRLL